jgi:site-specific DNA-methyltransferase (adenine-specific)
VAHEKVVIGDATLYLSDCREVLPLLPVHDLILTDPPFGMGNFVQTDGNVRGRGDFRGKRVAWNDAPPDEAVFALIREKSKHRVIWGANFFNCFEEDGGAIVWLKRQPMPNFSKADIAACTHYKKTETVEIPWTNFTVTRDAETDHPCERPVRLYEWCLDYMPKGKTVCDPFMGSGSVGVAALRMGRMFTGIERDRRYFDACCERISRAQAQGQMFAPEVVTPVQIGISEG